MNQTAAALLISSLAGLATTIGGIISLGIGAKPKREAFAMALSFAGGVMLFVSFVEAYGEGVEKLEAALSERMANRSDQYRSAAASSIAMSLFFAGWIMASLINGVLDLALPVEEGKQEENDELSDLEIHAEMLVNEAETFASKEILASQDRTNDTKSRFPFLVWIKRWWRSPLVRCLTGAYESSEEERKQASKTFANDLHRMRRLGITAMLVLTAHNIPEGIVTFTSSSMDLKFGLGLGIAVGIHNIPEGIAVAVPILYGTGSKWKAMFYTILSGIAEPLGGLLAWAALGNDPHDMAFGVLFLLTAGLMVNVALKEMIFSSLRYDGGNVVTSAAVLFGMIAMAITLIALEFTAL